MAERKQPDRRAELIAYLKKMTTGPAYERISRVLMVHPERLEEVVSAVYQSFMRVGRPITDEEARRILAFISRKYSRNGKIEFR